ncbi:MAG: hypothetical protein KAS32_29450 [Candidatus Peribacteraceae bacterium]|nr:hypothetical protein [Candidatus Peribacteraceae bacterium]
MVKPISPSEAGKKINIPDQVIEVFNDLIQKNFDSTGKAKVMQDDVVELITGKTALQGMPKEDFKKKILDEHWLDVEDIYRAAGWVVEYDKSAYNESYKPYFVFSKEKK